MPTCQQYHERKGANLYRRVVRAVLVDVDLEGDTLRIRPCPKMGRAFLSAVGMHDMRLYGKYG